MAAKATLTATELAEKLGTDPRTVRKFLRDSDGGMGTKVGKGNRHQIDGDSKSVTAMRKKFTAWNESREAAAAAKAEKVEASPVAEPKKAPKPKITKLAPSGATKAKLEEKVEAKA